MRHLSKREIIMKTRNDVKKYAQDICLAMLERTANRTLCGRIPETIDHSGYTSTFLEEFCRPLWGLAPIIRESDEPLYINIGGKPTELCGWIREVLVSGATPESEHSFDIYRDATGDYPFAFQNLTELAGLFVGFYFAREKLWDPLSKKDKDRVAEWLYVLCKIKGEKPAANNHVWFAILALTVLKRFGYVFENADQWIAAGLDKLDTMYISDGWYQDGRFGRFDYYEAWSMHSYPLMWILLENDEYPGYAKRKKEYIARTERFFRQYVHFFDTTGAHVPFGRSLTYRFAASCVFPLAVLCGCDIDVALAKTVMLRNIGYFAENVITENGVLPPGYLYNSPALVENYTSDGGAYWCAKTFLCLLIGEDHPFWTSKPIDLPIEKHDYLFYPECEKVDLAVTGTKQSGVTVYNNVFQYYQLGKYLNRFNDMAAYYCKFAYNSRAGFSLSCHDRVAYDGMISLITADESMESHRWGFTAFGHENGIMLSKHIPFSNDGGTIITTALIPLENGYHARIHKVVLSYEYAVREGGFTVPAYNDGIYFREFSGGCAVNTDRLVSVQRTVSPVPLKFAKTAPQPGLHLLAPRSAYPSYATEVLKKGTYYFASVFGVFDCEYDAVGNCPALDMNENSVTVAGKTFDLKILDCGE